MTITLLTITCISGHRMELAKEFNYSLPRQHKGYDTMGYKFPSLPDQRSMATFLPIRENDNGYYSEHTYESPVCEPVLKKEYGALGRPVVIPTDIEGHVALCQDIQVDKKEPLNVETNHV